MNRTIFLSAVLCAALNTCLLSPADAEPTYLAVLEFAGPDGGKLADSLRLRLGRNEQLSLIDAMTIKELTAPTGGGCDKSKVKKLLVDQLAANSAIYGTVSHHGQGRKVRGVCVKVEGGVLTTVFDTKFVNDTQRWRAEISRQIAERFTGLPEWTPPQYGDEKIPTDLPKPLNINGDFEKGSLGWEAADLVSTFFVKTDTPRGGILKVRTDLKRDDWLEYKRNLLLGRTTPKDAPEIKTDTSYSSVGGLEGVHFSSGWIDAQPGSRYLLAAECKASSFSGAHFPKVFIKGYLDWRANASGLPERSLVELGLTGESFAGMPESRRKELIKQDTIKNPDRYRRECYRWYLSCRTSRGKWEKSQAIFPPRGGLPQNVKWLKIQIYSYWPAGEYLWDNVNLYQLKKSNFQPQKNTLPK